MKNKLTKIERAAMLERIMHVLNGETIYTEREVVEIKRRIEELEAEVELLRGYVPEIKDHENIRGREYYK